MKQKKIDVILACYNGESFIGQQIRSILASFDSITGFITRLLIADDGSNDRTLEIISEINDRRISIIDSARVGGVIKNFSRLIDYSDADYIFFSDQDDLWAKDKVAIFMETFEKLEKKSFNIPILLHSDVTLVDGNLNKLHESMMSTQKIICNPTFSELLVSNSVTGCAMAVNRALVSKIITLNDSSVVMHDWYLALIAKYFGILELIPGSYVLYRQHGGNQVGSKAYRVYEKLSPFKAFEFIKTSRNKILRSLNQAKLFYTQYYGEGSFSSNTEDLLLYISSQNSFIDKVKMFSSGRFRKMGRIRNLMFIFIYMTM